MSMFPSFLGGRDAQQSTPAPVPSAPMGPDSDRFRPFVDRIRSEIEKGLQNERRGRLDAADINADFYEERWDNYTTEWRLDRKAIRCLPIMREAVYHLTAHLYRNPPARSFADFPTVTSFLEVLYQRNAMDALWPDADRLAVVNQVAAFEVAGNLGPDAERRPVRFMLWGGEQFTVWLDPDDATTPFAVATLDKMDQQRRLRLWTHEARYTYVTDKLAPGQTAGGTAYRLQSEEANPYRDATGNPILPFSFVHFTYPSRYFWGGGPGDGLRKANDHINFRLSKLADDILKWRLMMSVTGARPEWNFPKDLKAGEPIVIPPAIIDASGTAVSPQLEYHAPQLTHVPQDWDDLNRFLELVLQLNHIPPAAFRLEQSATMSGVALVAEQIPLITWARGRCRPFGYYEKSLATRALQVAASHMENNGVPDVLGVSVEELRDAEANGDLTTRWGEMAEELPGPTRDQSDQSRLDSYRTSRTQLLMERKGLTRDEAEKQVKETVRDLKREQKLISPIQQAAMGSFGGGGATEGATDGGAAGESDESEPEPEAGESGESGDKPEEPGPDVDE